MKATKIQLLSRIDEDGQWFIIRTHYNDGTSKDQFKRDKKDAQKVYAEVITNLEKLRLESVIDEYRITD